VEIYTFQCPKCRAILQISGAPPPEKIVRCTQCEFIFPVPPLLPSPRKEVSCAPDLVAYYREAPATWIEWPSSANVESPSPAAENPPRLPRGRFRPRRRAFPWVFLVVGLLVGLALAGLLIVVIVALFWSRG